MQNAIIHFCRLSELAGAKLTEGNPNIADLSDKNRPTNLAENFSELYDNEWTCLLYTSPSPRDLSTSRMPSSA